MANVTLTEVIFFIGCIFIVAIVVTDLTIKDERRAFLNRLRNRRLGRWVGLDRRKERRK